MKKKREQDLHRGKVSGKTLNEAVNKPNEGEEGRTNISDNRAKCKKLIFKSKSEIKIVVSVEWPERGEN